MESAKRQRRVIVSKLKKMSEDDLKKRLAGYPEKLKTHRAKMDAAIAKRNSTHQRKIEFYKAEGEAINQILVERKNPPKVEPKPTTTKNPKAAQPQATV